MTDNVNCNIHGENEGCMICQHLQAESGLGYARVLVTPEADDYETAMCENCEIILLSEAGWTDKLSSIAGWKLFCKKCYENTLKKHTLVAEGYMK